MTRRLPATTVYYGLRLLLSMPAFVVIAVYFVRDVGMSPLQLVLMGTVMEAAVFLFEIPTGAAADAYGRRRSIILGFLIQGGATILLGSVPSFAVIAAAWALWGFGYTFQSGAYEAWITDEVGADAVGPVFLRGARLAYAGGLFGLGASVAIGVWSLQAAVIAGGALEVACGLACIFVMPETGFVRRSARRRRESLRELASTAASAGGSWGRSRSCCSSSRSRCSPEPRARRSTGSGRRTSSATSACRRCSLSTRSSGSSCSRSR
jgi:MFS family permease